MKNIMDQRKNGYKVARRMDKEINDLLESYPIVEHPWMWLTIIRTVATGLSLVGQMAQKIIDDA